MKEEKLRNCIKEIKKEGNLRKIDKIIDYVKSLESFINLLQEQGENFNEILSKSSMIMKHVSKLKDEFVVQFGEKGEDFYIILNGVVGIFVPMLKEYYMTEEEFMLYLLKLRKNGQKDLIHHCLRQNSLIFSIPYENFDDLLYDLSNNKSREGVFADSEYVKREAREICRYINTEEYKQNLIKTDPEKYMSGNDVSSKIKDMNKKIKEDLKKNNENSINSKKSRNLLGRRKKMKIYKYEMVRYLTVGDTFGELALENKNSKRTATIIAHEDCDFAVINKNEYNLLIKDSLKKYKKKFFILIYSYKIFKEISVNLFNREYFNNFRFCRFSKNRFLLKDGLNCSEIYFILNGEFELYIEKNIFELNIIINKLKSLINNIKFLSIIKLKNKKIHNFLEKLSESEKRINNIDYDQDIYKDLLSKKKKIKLGIYTSRQIIGFENFINFLYDKDNKSLINSKCISFYGEFYRTSYSKYRYLYENEKNVKFYTNELFILNTCYLIERLLLHKSFELNKIKTVNNNFESIFTERKLMESHHKKKINLENKIILTESFKSITSPKKTNDIKTSPNKIINKFNSYREMRKKNSPTKIRFIKHNIFQKNKKIFNLKNINNEKFLKKKFKIISFKEKSKENIDCSDSKENSNTNMKGNNLNDFLNNSIDKTRNPNKLNNFSLNSFNTTKKDIKIKKPLSSSRFEKTAIKIPNIYKIFFPIYSKNEENLKFNFNSKENSIEKNNKFNQMLKVYKLNEENLKSQTINVIKNKTFYKKNKLILKEHINYFKQKENTHRKIKNIFKKSKSNYFLNNILNKKKENIMSLLLKAEKNKYKVYITLNKSINNNFNMY